MNGVGFPIRDTMAGASRGAICVPEEDGRTGHESEAPAESALAWRIRSTGAAAVKSEVAWAVDLIMIGPGPLLWYWTVRDPPSGVTLPKSTVCCTGDPESDVADTK